MTTENNAQPVLTDDEILTATLYGQSGARMIRNGRAIESAVLSKLRAPVADERAAFEKRFSVPPENWTKSGGGGYRNIWIETRWEGWRARAALASAPAADMQPLGPEFAKVLSDNFDSLMVRIPSECAPVAPQACPTDVCQAAKADGVLCANDECDRANGVRPASAPVAGEAQPVAWRYRRASQKESMRLAGREPSEAEWHFAPHATRTTEMREGLRYNFAPSSDHVDWEPLYAAPQASEAVRDALKTCGSKVFKALAAIARAEGPDTRQADDPELIYREPVMDEAVRIRQAYDELSAALSAQPGAEPLSNPKQFALTAAENIRAGAPYDDPAFEALCREHGIWGTAEAALCAVFWRQAGQQRAAGDERAAFEATYQADYDDPGAACEREHFGKGYRAALAAQPGAQKPHPKQHNDGADLE